MSSSDVDTEKLGRPKEFQVGFADFAEYIASDEELSLYKGFSSLAARNLLYFQAELQALGRELKSMDEADQLRMRTTADDQERMAIESAARAWERLKFQCDAGDEREGKRMAIILKLRKLMKDYEKALLRRSQLLSLEKPNRGTSEAFANWFRFKKPLRDSGWHLLDEERDMVALKTGTDQDRLGSLIQYCFGYHLREDRENQPQSWGTMYYFKDTIIARIVAVIAVIISAFFLIGAIVLLYFVTPMGARLGIISAFTTGFAATVGLLTNAKRAEVFGASAAYAAVLVVFVSGNIGSS